MDTAGIGSIFADNTAVTRAFVPHIEAVLAVLGADPPISGEELLRLEEIAATVDEMVFVLNKADRLTAKECEEAIEFARGILHEKLRRDPPPQIVQISAAEWFDGCGPSRDAPQPLADLERIIRESGHALVRNAEERGTKRLAAALLREIEPQRNTLIAPVGESHALRRLCVA